MNGIPVGVPHHRHKATIKRHDGNSGTYDETVNVSFAAGELGEDDVVVVWASLSNRGDAGRSRITSAGQIAALIDGSGGSSGQAEIWRLNDGSQFVLGRRFNPGVAGYGPGVDGAIDITQAWTLPIRMFNDTTSGTPAFNSNFMTLVFVVRKVS